jgi:hypothetical protein
MTHDYDLLAILAAVNLKLDECLEQGYRSLAWIGEPQSSLVTLHTHLCSGMPFGHAFDHIDHLLYSAEDLPRPLTRLLFMTLDCAHSVATLHKSRVAANLALLVR